MDKRKLKIYFQTKTDFLDDFLSNGSLCMISFGNLSVAQQHLGLDACIMHRFFIKFNMYAIQFMDTSVGNIQYWIFATHISYWNPDLVTSISVGEKVELLRT